ncbi:MAG: glycosyltransferase [Aquificaceae bacterium]|nr:glycosyltransferase [Aquificaceae bacterium]
MGEFLAKADLHLHSKASNLPGGWFSKLINCPESYAEPKELYKRLKERGMSFVTITDHNTISGVLEIAHNKDVFISCEYTVSVPDLKAKIHVLTYGISEVDHEELLRLRENVYDFVKYLKKRAIAHSLAHPFFSVQQTEVNRQFIERMVLLFDNWELINGTRGDGALSLEESIARLYDGWDRINLIAEKHSIEPQRSRDKIAFTAGSDDHGGMDVGRTWTAIQGAKTREEYLNGLIEGRSSVGTQELSEARLLNMIFRVGYDHYRKKGRIPSELKPFTDYIFMHSDNPMIGMLIRSFFGINPPRENLLLEICNIIPSVAIDRLINSPSPQKLGEFILAILAHLSPAFLLYAQKREERKIQELSKDFGLNTSKPKLVAYLTDTYHHINGVARSAKIVKKIAAEEDLPFKVVVCNSEVEEDGIINLKPLIEVPTPFYEELRMGIPSLIDLMHLLDSNGFTQVHLATQGPLGILGFIAGKLLGLRITSAFHTDIPAYAKTYTRDQKLEDLLWKAFVFLGKNSDRFFVPSEHYRVLLSRKGLDYAKMSVFKRGVDTELFNPSKRVSGFWKSKLGLSQNSKVVLFVGRVSQEKGIDTFLEVARRLQFATFIVVGDGPYRPIAETKSPENVYFTGFMRGEELATAYASSDVFLFPSETETYGQVVLEAMASGLPPIVSSKGASHEHIEQGVNGFVAHSLEEYVAKTELLLSQDSIREGMSKEAIYFAQSMDLRKTYMDYLYTIAGLGRVVYEAR